LRPSPETQIAVREFVARHGANAAGQHFGIHPATVARVGAGMVVQGCVLRAVEEGLRTPPEGER
jgi:hypothetical protein